MEKDGDGGMGKKRRRDTRRMKESGEGSYESHRGKKGGRGDAESRFIQSLHHCPVYLCVLVYLQYTNAHVAASILMRTVTDITHTPARSHHSYISNPILYSTRNLSLNQS